MARILGLTGAELQRLMQLGAASVSVGAVAIAMTRRTNGDEQPEGESGVDDPDRVTEE